MNNPKYFHKPVLEKFKTQKVKMWGPPPLCGYWLFDWLKRYKIEQSPLTDDVPSAMTHVGGYVLLKAVFFYVFKDK